MAQEDVTVVVGGDVGPLERGMRRGGKSVQSFSAKAGAALKKLASQMAKMAAAAAAVAAATVAGLTKRGLEAVDAQAKLARSIRTTIGSLQVLQRVADLEGLSNMDNAMESLTRRLSRAEQGTGPAVKALGQLQLSAGKLLKLPVDKRLELIGDRMRKLIPATQQQAIAFDLFNATGAKIAEILPDIGKKADAARRELKAMGVILTGVEARQVEAANDAMSSFGVAVDAVQNRLAVVFAPILKHIGDRFADLIKKNNGFRESIETGMEVGVKVVGQLANALHVLRIAFEGVKQAALIIELVIVDSFRGALEGVRLFANESIKIINGITDSINKFRGEEIFPRVDPFDQPFVKGLDDLVEVIDNQISDSVKSFKDLMAAPWPAEAFEEFIERIRQASKKGAEIELRMEKNFIEPTRRMGATVNRTISEISEKFSEPLNLDVKFGDQRGPGEGFAESLFARLEALQAFLADKEELEKISHAKRLEELQVLNEEFVITAEERFKLQEELERGHQERLKQIRAQGAHQQINVERNKRRVIVGAAQDMVTQVGRINEDMFKAAQVTGAAIALVNAYVAASQTLADPTLGFWAKLAAAAQVLATGIGFVASIKSASSSGATGGGVSVGGQPSQPVASQQQQGPERNLTIIAQGQVFGPQIFAQIAEQMNEFIKDGGRIRNVAVQRA